MLKAMQGQLPMLTVRLLAPQRSADVISPKAAHCWCWCCWVQVSLRIAGTAAGGTVGWAALHATHDPVLLLLIMCAVGVLLAPLASASFHFRLATALTVISMLVVVLCQFDPDSGESRATDTFYGTRLVEVGGAWGVGWDGVLCMCDEGVGVCIVGFMGQG